jgi:hypothetical protein
MGGWGMYVPDLDSQAMGRLIGYVACGVDVRD